MIAAALAGQAPAVIDLNQPGSYLNWNFLTISVANLALIGVMVVIFGAALLLPFPGRHRPYLPPGEVAEPEQTPGYNAEPGDERMWTARARRSAPVFFWLLDARQVVTAQSPGAPVLPARPLGGRQPRGGLAVTVNVGQPDPFRLEMTRDGTSWLVAGQSLAGPAHTKRLLLYAEILAGPFVLLAMFFGCLVVGQRALAPVEQSRRLQLEFTADASHELRTPLSVIRAETDVALSTPRDAAGYRDTLVRIQGESARLRHLVDDMLWLARFDSRPPPPDDEPFDLATLAKACADRFRAVGPAITVEPPPAALINAQAEWIDQLAGVLVDNACRYAGPDGLVRIGVRARGSRISLTVEDSGPGIVEAERPRLFDRFHRATEDGSGSGLGLAIGDSIVRSTGGRWHIGKSPLGGALIEVSWRHSQPHRLAAQRVAAGNGE